MLFNISRNSLIERRKTVDPLVVSLSPEIGIEDTLGKPAIVEHSPSNCDDDVFPLRIALLHDSIELANGETFVEGNRDFTLSLSDRSGRTLR